MSLFKHRHQWETVGHKFQPPITRRFELERISEETMSELLYGFTLLTQRCTECGWVEGSRVAGELDLTGVGGISTGDQTS